MSWVDEANAALLTDLYELTMAASYHSHGMGERATFDLFVRELPARRNFMISCGLEQALDYIENLRFEPDSIEYLRSLGLFSEAFLSYLAGFSFTGDVWAVPEGEAVFEREPLLRVTAPLIEAQLLETFLINCITFQTMVASKAARVAIAARDRSFVDFSLRRDHAADAALKAARAAFVGGASGTSNVLAGKIYGLPVSGTMAHSYVMAFEDEEAAFRAYMRDFPESAVLLIDTFDIEEGARRAARVANELGKDGMKLRGVRIDSGELAPLARSVRKILDEAGLDRTEIILSGDLDEYRVKDLLDDGVPVDSFGIGTQLGTSADAPTLGGVYKLVADSRGPKIKLSAGKATLPGCKQVYRVEANGRYERDVIALQSERVEGRALLQKVMTDGVRNGPSPSLAEIQRRCRASIDSLPEALRSLETQVDYRVDISEELQGLIAEMKAQAR
jgi:nicotinate phosphoribosyltransferase